MLSKTFAILLITATCGIVCSHHVVKTRMIGGDPVGHSLPYIASVKHLVNNIPVKFCLGSIIDSRWILSSALCLLTANPENVVVDLGVHTHSPTPSQNRHHTSKIIIHPNFNSTTGKNDIALLQVYEPISLANSFSRIKLGLYKKQKDTKLTAIGWNNDVEHGLGHGKPEGYQLARLKLTIISMEDCKNKFPELNDLVRLDDTQICGYDGQGKDMCGVDYGGPLINEETGELVGVFNDVIFAANGHGHDCHPHHDHPLVFTDVTTHLQWIRSMTHKF